MNRRAHRWTLEPCPHCRPQVEAVERQWRHLPPPEDDVPSSVEMHTECAACDGWRALMVDHRRGRIRTIPQARY